ncbi:MAG: PASTA domain-containing protein [Bacteroidetes bacterium]|nr:PASTA domain-containing protein [Bacteroidota bacterium]
MKRDSFFGAFLNFIKSRRFLKHVGLVILFYIVVVFVTMFILDWSTNHGEKIEVPNIVGKNANEAKEILEESGLKYQILDSIYDPKKPNGTVIQQTPEATKKTSIYVKSGRIIGLRVTKKQRMVQVPNLINKSQRFATSILKNRGLKFEIRYKPVIEELNGVVVEQIYKGKKIINGTMIPAGATITIYVGEFVIEDPEKIPDLYGLTISEAISLLDELGFRYDYGCSDCQTREDTLSAVITHQSPEFFSGREISKSSIITFTGSMNPEINPEKSSQSKSNQNALKKERDALKENGDEDQDNE